MLRVRRCVGHSVVACRKCQKAASTKNPYGDTKLWTSARILEQATGKAF